MDIIQKIKEIYTPKYIVLNVAALIAYYLLFYGVLSLQNPLFIFVTIPPLLLYSLIISSSILLTISVYTIKHSGFSYSKTSSGLIGTATALLGSVISGCGCTAPLLFSLTTFGISISQLIMLDSFIFNNSSLLFGVMIVINLFLIIYYLIKKQPNRSCNIENVGGGHGSKRKKV
ncbi:MAG: hypothetical protein M1538_02840 [Candidatus Marsarchaeota archaeon]|nr:hypothetical protein [Candidatus Marsarchaeota archaeon]